MWVGLFRPTSSRTAIYRPHFPHRHTIGLHRRRRCDRMRLGRRVFLVAAMTLAAFQATTAAAMGLSATATPAAPAAAAKTAAAMAAAVAAAAAEAGSRSARAAAMEAEVGAEGGWARVSRLVHGCRPHATDLDAGEDAAAALGRLQRCLVDAALACLGDVLRQERVMLAPGVELVRLRNSDGAREAGAGGGPFGRALALLRSYSLRVGPPDAPAQEGRLRRHHYKHMFPLMVMSFMALSAFMVPMGFQFMAVLGGKALLLSKMALLVASLLTYKKLATDFTPHHSHGHGHGHGHSAYHDPFYYGWHDRAASSNKWQ